MYKKPTKKKVPLNWKQYFLIITGFILLFPLVRFIRKEIEKYKNQNLEIKENRNYNENQNPVVSENKANKITVRKDVQSAAKKLAHDLGTKYSDKNNMWSWIDPRGWTENDKAVVDNLIFQRGNYNYIKRLYNEIYTNNRSLSDDLYSLLDPTELKRLETKIKIN